MEKGLIRQLLKVESPKLTNVISRSSGTDSITAAAFAVSSIRSFMADDQLHFDLPTATPEFQAKFASRCARHDFQVVTLPS
jgi:hypothetical protein